MLSLIRLPSPESDLAIFSDNIRGLRFRKRGTISGHHTTFTGSQTMVLVFVCVSGDMLHIYVAPNTLIVVGGIHKIGDAGRGKIRDRFVDSLKFDNADTKYSKVCS